MESKIGGWGKKKPVDNPRKLMREYVGRYRKRPPPGVLKNERQKDSRLCAHT